MPPIRILLPLCAALLMAPPAAADPTTGQGTAPPGGAPPAAPPLHTAPLDAAEFDARTQGRTITYSAYGQPYGVEQYLPGRRVLWAFEGGACKEGTWFQQGEMICFDYRDDGGLQCWTFHDTPEGLMARFLGDPGAEPLVSLSESPEPLDCPGPEVGV
ncbi:hypothetical protein [Phaeovulum sp. NW3]|uniref:hypothetical protein n=1 Tax=Phaeovulum sp. NW3 TaxID=2934933 RepID=UPI0020208A9F|nr:hypothetical protein [Phaeovulum sp. NW3]MCL7464377.1 hypothetical protein [Phaeovulum sp. NW3]